MDTKTSTLLAEDIWVISRMDWGAQGWITFSTINWKVWILKEDGTELKQLTFGSRDLVPIFLDDGAWLVYSKTEPIETSQIVKLNVNAIGIDSFCRIEGWCSWDYCSFNAQTEEFAAPRNGVALYNKGGIELKRTFVAGTNVADIPDIEWLPDNENILFITRYGNNQGTIYKVNSVTDELNMVKEGCENRFYNDLAISPDGTFMLAQKGTAVVEDCDINTTWQIVKMDLDGNNEEVIDLSE
jgi:Tol biopolymer transport system component